MWCSGLNTKQVPEGLNLLLLVLSLKCCVIETSHFTSLVLMFFSCGMGTIRATLLNELDFYLDNKFIFFRDPSTVPCL